MILESSARPTLAEKLLVPPALIGVCTLLYFFLSHFDIRIVGTPGQFTPLATRLDDYVPFVPGFVFTYYLYYPWVFLSVFAVRDRRSFYHGVVAFLVLQLAALVTFALLPSRMERPEVVGTGVAEVLVRLMYRLDAGGYNLLPSLHVAHTTLVSLLFLRYRRRWAPPVIVGTAAICVSTVLIKQHFVVDLPFGFVYALAAFHVTAGLPARVGAWLGARGRPVGELAGEPLTVESIGPRGQLSGRDSLRR